MVAQVTLDDLVLVRVQYPQLKKLHIFVKFLSEFVILNM